MEESVANSESHKSFSYIFKEIIKIFDPSKSLNNYIFLLFSLCFLNITTLGKILIFSGWLLFLFVTKCSLVGNKTKLACLFISADIFIFGCGPLANKSIVIEHLKTESSIYTNQLLWTISVILLNCMFIFGLIMQCIMTKKKESSI